MASSKITAAVLERIAQMPEKAVAFRKLHFRVGNGGFAVRAPVDDALAAIDQAFFIEADKDLADRFGAALVQREALAVPVAGRTKLLELLDNAAAVFLFPLPRALKESLAADLLFRQAFLAHGLDNFRLRRDGGVVGARNPQGAVALHSAPADQNILQRFVQRMPHMKLPGDVRRRDDNRIRFFLRIAFGVKIFSFQPETINPVFHFLRIIGFR